MPDPDVERLFSALLDRHAAPMRRPEFLKAIRALSARYVERRAVLPDRSPLDSPGKRAAFAAFFAPLHFLTVAEILRALGPQSPASRIAAPTRIVDLGCGTGAAGAAWARHLGGRPALHGVDRSGWAVGEANWTWRTLGLSGRATRGDLVAEAGRLLARADGEPPSATGVLLAWSANELDDRGRRALLPHLVELARRGAAVLIVEPISRRAAPWFDDWTAAMAEVGGRHDEWRFDEARPAALEALARHAGLKSDALLARSLAANLP